MAQVLLSGLSFGRAGCGHYTITSAHYPQLPALHTE